VKLVVTLPSQAATQSHRNPFGGGYMPLAFAFVLLPFAGKRLSRKAGALGCLLLIGIATASLMGLAGCGKSSSGYNGQGPQSYNLTITATSGSLSHSTTVNLTVQ
jgi:hypothetical protein